MAEQCGASPPVLACAGTDDESNVIVLTHGAGPTGDRTSFGGGKRDTAHLSAACGEQPARVLQPDHLTNPHAAAGDAVVAAAGNPASFAHA